MYYGRHVKKYEKLFVVDAQKRSISKTVLHITPIYMNFLFLRSSQKIVWLIYISTKEFRLFLKQNNVCRPLALSTNNWPRFFLFLLFDVVEWL